MSAKGKKNRYVCDTCGRSIITINRDEGTTPFQICCCESGTQCPGGMSSALCRLADDPKPTHQWIRPTEAQIGKQCRDLGFDHIPVSFSNFYGQGGLMLMPLEAVD